MVQQALEGMEIYKKPTTELELLQVALTNNAAIDVIERLAALQKDARERTAKVEFNDALNRVQSAIKRIAPDMENPAKRSKYASYAAIDRVIRPIYSQEGFSLSFTHDDSPKPDHVRVVCRVALGAHVENYRIDMPVDTEGAKGGAIMNKTQATAAADSYGKRYLVKDIFNIAIGEDDSDGELTNGWMAERLEWIANCRNPQELSRIFQAAFNEAKEQKASKAMLALVEAKDKKKAEFEQ